MDSLHLVIAGVPIFSTLDFVLLGVSIAVLGQKGYFARPTILLLIVAKLLVAFGVMNYGAFVLTYRLLANKSAAAGAVIALIVYALKLALMVWVARLPPCAPPDEVTEGALAGGRPRE